MKKFLLLSLIIISFTSICIAATPKNYTDQFVHRFEVCGAHSETHSTQVPTRVKNPSIFNLKITESVVGIRNGKCAVKSTVYCEELKKDIFIVDCAFNQQQRTALIAKMKAAKNNQAEYQKLQETMNNYIKNRPDVCRYRNLLEEDDD